MSEVENQQPEPEMSETAELKEQCEMLGQQVRTLLYAMVVASFTLTAFLGLQARRAGKELAQIRPQAAQINELYKRDEPGLRIFLTRLMDFGKTHPDFAAILQKYPIQTVKAPSSMTAPDSTVPAQPQQ